MKILFKAIYPYVFFILYFIIPFDNYIRAFPNLLLGLLTVLFPFVISKKSLKKTVSKPAAIFLLFFIYLFVSSYFIGRIEEDFKVLKKMLIPLGMVLLYLPVGDFDKIKKAVIFSSLAAILFSIFQFSVFSYQAHDVSLTFFQNTVDALLIDRPYLGLLSVLSILVSYKSLTKNYSPYNSYYLSNIIVNSIYIILIMSKIAIVILVLLIFLKQFYGKKKKIHILYGVIVFLTGNFLLYTVFKTQINTVLNPYKHSSEVAYNTSKMPNIYRSIIWKCAKKIAQENKNSIFGMGFQNTNNRLVSCYKTKIKDNATKQTFVSNKFNTHNQFIDFFISSGWLGLVLFVLFWVVLIIKNSNRFFPTALIMSMVVFGLTENFMHRQIGAYYFGAILILLLINVSKKEPVQSTLSTM